MSRRFQADLALLACALIWGGSFIVVKNGLNEASVFVFVSLRFALAAIAVGLTSFAALRTRSSGLWRAGAILGVIMFAGYALETAGLQFTSAAKGAFITGSTVVWVPLLSAAFGLRQINRWIWAGALAAFSGLYLLAVPPEGLTRLNRGDVMIAFCAIAFALQIIAAGKYSRRHSVRGLNPIQAAMTAMLSAAAIPLLARIHWEAPRANWNGALAFALLYTAIGSTAVAFALQFWAQRYTTPSHTAIVFSLQPVFAALFGRWFASEILTGREVLGAGMIFAGILIAELKGPPHEAVESAATLGESPKEAE